MRENSNAVLSSHLQKTTTSISKTATASIKASATCPINVSDGSKASFAVSQTPVITSQSNISTITTLY